MGDVLFSLIYLTEPHKSFDAWNNQFYHGGNISYRIVSLEIQIYVGLEPRAVFITTCRENGLAINRHLQASNCRTIHMVEECNTRGSAK